MSALLKEKPSNKNVIWYLFMTAIMFLYIYEINFSVFGLPTFVTSRRLVVVFLLIWNFAKYGTIRTLYKQNTVAVKCIKKNTNFTIYMLLYSFVLIILWGVGSGETVFESLVRQLAFGILPIGLFYNVFDDVEDLMRVILLATIVQSVFVVVSLINPGFAEYLDATFCMGGGEYSSSHRSGYAGGLDCITAPGCLKFSLGLVACLYFAIKTNNFKYILLYFYLGLLATMIARTGLVVSAVGLIVILFSSKRQQIVKLLASLTVIAIVFIWFLKNIGFDDIFDFYRLVSLFEGEGIEGFFNDYAHNEDTTIPPFSLYTIVGIGTTSGVSGTGIPVNVDGGFLRIYAAVGLINALLFYGVLFAQMYKSYKLCKVAHAKKTLLFFVILVVLAEFKEFTILQQYMICIFFLSAALVFKNKELNNV